MYHTAYCRMCKQELTGAIQLLLARDGKFVVIVSQETSDCNWRQCKECKNIICKRCYAVQPQYCCSVDRIIASERAEVVIKRNVLQNLLDRSREVLRRTHGSPHSQDTSKSSNNGR